MADSLYEVIHIFWSIDYELIIMSRMAVADEKPHSNVIMLVIIYVTI